MNLVRFRYGENNINTGPLKEIPEICVDHFLGDDLNSSVFLLSHAHTDHLVGLETEEFLRRLRQPGIKLYCHTLTPILLGSFERYLQGPSGIESLIAERKIVPVDVNEPKRIRIPRLTGYLDVTITFLPAGHCPGSVMFLFETDKIRILHTGDFRLGLSDLQKAQFLHKNGALKPIDHLYIDTTFGCKSAEVFPDRKKVLTQAFDRIRNWIQKSKNHIVNISFSARYAHEYVLSEINRVFGQTIHVNPDRRQIYKYIPGICDIGTLDNQTQFHLCGNRDCVQNAEILTLRLSSMWYTKTKQVNRDSYISWKGPRYMTLCYSMHSSLGEIAQTIDYLKPQIVTPLVLPAKTDISEVQTAIRSMTTSSYEFEDYRSTRDDFDGIGVPAAPCVEERDETDEIEMEIDIPLEKVQDEDEVNDDQEWESPTKRLKISEETRQLWKFNFSPSPNSSQSSHEGGSQGGSQELKLESGDFVAPTEKVSHRKNLMTTSLQSLEADASSTMINVELPAEFVIGENDSNDPGVHSQKYM